MTRIALGGLCVAALLVLPARAGCCGGGCGDGGSCCQASAALPTWQELGESGLQKRLVAVRWELHELNHSDTASYEAIAAKRAEYAHLQGERRAFVAARAELRLALALAFAPATAETRIASAAQ